MNSTPNKTLLNKSSCLELQFFSFGSTFPKYFHNNSLAIITSFRNQQNKSDSILNALFINFHNPPNINTVTLALLYTNTISSSRSF